MSQMGSRLGHSAMSVQCPVYSKGNIGARFVTTHAKASWRGNRRSERIGFGRNVAHVSTWQRRTGRVSEDAGRRGAPAGKPRRAGDRRLAGTGAVLCGDAGARRRACHFGQPIRPTGNHRRHRARGGRGKFRGHGRDARRIRSCAHSQRSRSNGARRPLWSTMPASPKWSIHSTRIRPISTAFFRPTCAAPG